METIVYLIRHSIADKKNNEVEIIDNDSLQLKNEKQILTVLGEKKAEIFSQLKEFDNIDLIVSSNYTRTKATAKYIAEKNQIKLHIDANLGERKFGIDKWEELPENYEQKQWNDNDYSTSNGESINQVMERMDKSISKLVLNNLGKKIVIVSHSTAIASYFLKYCEKKQENGLIEVSHKGNILLDGKWNSPEIYKIIFESNTVTSIERIRPIELEIKY